MFFSAAAAIATPVQRTAVTGMMFKSRDNILAIFLYFFEISVFTFKHFYAQIENAHKNRLMETQPETPVGVV